MKQKGITKKLSIELFEMSAKYAITLSLLTFCDLTTGYMGHRPNFIAVDQGLNKDFMLGVSNERAGQEFAERRTIDYGHTDKEITKLIKRMSKDAELHIHTIIKYDSNLQAATENHYYTCEKPDLSDALNKLCSITSNLIQDIRFRSNDGPDPPIETNDLLEQEYQLMLNSNLYLSEEEENLNKLIMRIKSKILDINYQRSEELFSKNFFDFKENIKDTQLFKIIKNMPKGAALYSLDVGLLGPDYLLEITYQPNLYVCFKNNEPSFLFSKATPTIPCSTLWLSMEEARTAAKHSKLFDLQLRKRFTLVTRHHKGKNNNSKEMWEMYQRYITMVTQLLSYQPIWEKYLYDALKSFWDDKVMYVEIKTSLPKLYDLDSEPKDFLHTAFTYKKILDEFILEYPDFVGGKLIYSPGVLTDKDSLDETLKIAKKIRRNWPELFAGIDLIGQQWDKGRPLKYFEEDLMKSKAGFDYFFHVNDSNWYEWLEDDLFEAVQLPTKRIGHSFALVKHPLILKEMRNRDICLEVNIVANMVLNEFDDVRNHPLAQLLTYNIPIVLSSEAPGLWEVDALTHDFYVAFVGIVGRHADLRILKQLAMNSIKYSSASDKNTMMNEFMKQWNNFVIKTTHYLHNATMVKD